MFCVKITICIFLPESPHSLSWDEINIWMKADIGLDHLKWRRQRDFGVTSCDSFATAVPHLTFKPMSHRKTIQRNWRRLTGSAALRDNDQPPPKPPSFHASGDNTDTSRLLLLDCPMSGSSAENLVAYLTPDVLSVINMKNTVLWYVPSCCLAKKRKKPYAFIISVDCIILLCTKSGLDKSHGKQRNLLKNTKNMDE